MKLVSIIIPAYNKATLTVKTVESVLAQTYSNIEIIVVDDGSTDNTDQALKPFSDKIKYIYKENGGACSARNAGIAKASGDFIGLLDCDDTYLPSKVEECVNYFSKHPECGFVHTAAFFVDDKDSQLCIYSNKMSQRVGWIGEYLLKKNFICNSTVFARQHCFDKCGVFDETFFIPADWDMWLRLAQYYQAGYIDKPLTKYLATSSFTLKNLDLWEKEMKLMLDKTFLRLPDIKNSLKAEMVSGVYFRLAMSYLLIDDLFKARKLLMKSLAANSSSFKSIAGLSCLNLAPGLLKKIVRKRIFLS